MVGGETACGHAVLLRVLSWREFGVLSNRHYVCTLLQNLGVSFPKARCVSDHLDATKRLGWLQDKWPAMVRAAKRCKGLILFADEASVAPWGALAPLGPDGGTSRRFPPVGSAKAPRCVGPVRIFRGVWFTRASRADSTRKVLKGSCG